MCSSLRGDLTSESKMHNILCLKRFKSSIVLIFYKVSRCHVALYFFSFLYSKNVKVYIIFLFRINIYLQKINIYKILL